MAIYYKIDDSLDRWCYFRDTLQSGYTELTFPIKDRNSSPAYNRDVVLLTNLVLPDKSDYLFSYARSVNAVSYYLDASNCTSLIEIFSFLDNNYLFYRSSVSGSSDKVSDLIRNASKITNMSGMFINASMHSLDFSDFDTSKVTDMSYMFSGCGHLSNLDISNFNTSKVTNMEHMFNGCSALTSLDVSSFNTSKVTDMGYMFRNCTSLASLDLSSFDTSNVTNMRYVFYGCSSLTSLDLSNFNTSNVTDMSYMISNCSALTSINLSDMDFSKVIILEGFASYCSSLESINLNGLITSDTLITLESMFLQCSNLIKVNLSNINVTNVTNMNSLFENCSNLEEVCILNWHPTKLTNCEGMFRRCSKLHSILADDGTDWSEEIIALTSDIGMFYGATSLPNFDSNQITIDKANNTRGGYFGIGKLFNKYKIGMKI